ncbi:hypothetical protein BDQ17DRAFT_1441476 [Cyathus striatus]|nr:hypothetical protein BDQ17DRAFT_1441476 [Cyathus striatus]
MSSAMLHIIHNYVEKLSHLIPLLPGLVPYAEKDRMIQKVFKSIPVPSSLELSKDSELYCPFGMDVVLEYVCTAVETGKLPLDIAAIKVKWLVDGVEELIKSESGQVAPRAEWKQGAHKAGSDSDDENYAPPKRHCLELQSPTRIYDSNEDESADDTKQQQALRLSEKGTVQNPCKIESSDESDGKSAL